MVFKASVIHYSGNYIFTLTSLCLPLPTFVSPFQAFDIETVLGEGFSLAGWVVCVCKQKVSFKVYFYIQLLKDVQAENFMPGNAL